MKNQVKTDSENSAKVHPRFWERLTPFLDVIGAALIFGSWIFSHSLSQRAQDQAKTHQAIIDRVRAFRLYDDFGYRISDMQSDLVRTRYLVEDATRRDEPLNGKAESLPEALTWTGMTATQVDELNDCVQSIDRYAGQLSTPGSITQSIDRAKSGVSELSKAFDSARDEYDQLVEKQKASTSVADSVGAAEEGEALRVHVDHLWHNYDTAKQRMLQVSDELLLTAAAESKSAGQLAKQCEQLSWVLYTVGTLIILFGRAKSVFATAKKGED